MNKNAENNFLVISKGSWYNDIRKFNNKEAAREFFHNAVNKVKENYLECDDIENACFEEDDAFSYNGSIVCNDRYQYIEIVTAPENPIEELMLEIELASVGLVQYETELDDADVCRQHIEKLSKLLARLDELGLLNELKSADATGWFNVLGA